MPFKADMIPQTVPNNPIKGEVLPILARIARPLSSKTVLMVDRLTEIGVLVIADLDRCITGQCHPGGGAGLVVGQFGGRVEAGSGPEVFMKFTVLAPQPGELHALE
jgi:hypothetical protein